ncbi:MAG: insulinase family protein [Pseudomonadota bacterium]
MIAVFLLAIASSTFTDTSYAREPDASPATAQPTSSEPVWPFEPSDVPVDPGYVFGQLDNGMRYILRENATPEGTALVRMRIGSGSLEETEAERGLAHYLEHMAFNGSTNIPEGEMIKLLEREGLAFGADTNASTGFQAITYMLNLPRNDDDLLDTALMLMRETASELTIAEDAVERERGVILAERRDRNGFQQRNYEDSTEFLAPGAHYGDRLPIGTLEVIKSATAAQLRALYERTYTPANTVLVIVGDYPTELMEAKIRARFSDWQGPPAPAEPKAGPIDDTRAGLTDIYLDPALSERVSLIRLAPWQDEPDTRANRDRQLLRAIGYAIVNRRLARLARGENAPFRGANYSRAALFEDAMMTALSVSSVDGEWRAGLSAAVRELNQALQFGFTQAEVDEQLAKIRTARENAVKAEATRSNGSYVSAALGLIANERIPTTPDDRLAQFERLLPEITPQTVFDALKPDQAPLEEPMIRFTGRTAPEGGEDALRLAFGEALALPIMPPEDNGALQFAYTDFGSAGEVIEDRVDERLGLRLIRFANGVRLNLKQTDIREDRIAVQMTVDGGVLLNTKDEPLKTYLAGSLSAGGLGAHSSDELSTVLAGRSVGLGFGARGEGFSFSGGTTPRDLALQLQVMAALLTDPGYRAEGVERFRKGIDNFFETLHATPGRSYSTAIGGILSDKDPRFTLQDKSDYYALDFTKLKAAIGERLSRGAIELAIVGDFEEEEAIAAVASTLGALPQREPEFQPRDEARTRPFTSMRGQSVLTHQGEPDQAFLQLIWPTTDDSDLTEKVRLNLLASVVRLELQQRLREDLGQAYSPSAQSSQSRTYRGYGTFALGSSLEAAEIEPARAAIAELLADLRDKPLAADTLERARKPLKERYDNSLKSLGGWMALALFAQTQPERTERYFAFPEVLAGITPEDIRAAANTYLAPEDAVEIVVLPEETANGLAQQAKR